MIELRIDTSGATHDEAALLETLPGYKDLVAHLVAHGRELGVSLVIKRPLSTKSEIWLYNTPQGSMQMLVGPRAGGNSLLGLREQPMPNGDGSSADAALRDDRSAS